MPTPPTVTNLYARAAHFKQRWGNTSDQAVGDRYLAAGGLAGDEMIAAQSRDLDEVLLKLCELQEWVCEDGTASAKALLGSIIADIEHLIDPPGAADMAPVQPPPPPRPRPAPATVPIRVAATPTTLKVDRRTRAVLVDGVIYPSIIAASQSTGRSCAELRANVIQT